MTENKNIIKQLLGALIAANAIIILVLAYLQVFSSTPRAIVFIDFWGRLTIYSLWLMAYDFYQNYMSENKNANTTI